jgi:peptidylprolyl isomerase
MNPTQLIAATIMTIATTTATAADNPKVALDVTIGGQPAGTLTLELFADVVPRPPRTSGPCAPARRAWARAASR